MAKEIIISPLTYQSELKLLTETKKDVFDPEKEKTKSNPSQESSLEKIQVIIVGRI